MTHKQISQVICCGGVSLSVVSVGSCLWGPWALLSLGSPTLPTTVIEWVSFSSLLSNVSVLFRNRSEIGGTLIHVCVVACSAVIQSLLLFLCSDTGGMASSTDTTTL
jgi:hypothetical protein